MRQSDCEFMQLYTALNERSLHPMNASFLNLFRYKPLRPIPPYRFIQIGRLVGVLVGGHYLVEVEIDLVARYGKPPRPICRCRVRQCIDMRRAVKAFVTPFSLVIVARAVGTELHTPEID